MKLTLVSTILILISSLAFGQDDLSRLQGGFLTCELSTHLGLSSQKLRPHHFKCPKIQGFVLNETPVKKISFESNCNGKKTTFNVMTKPECNTVGCVTKNSELQKIAKTDIESKGCVFKLNSADLFEFYPLFSSAGPNKNEPFLDTMPVNNEDDPDYKSRINGGFPTESLPTVTAQEHIKISLESQKEICAMASLDVLQIDQQESYLKIIKEIYQNPDYQDDVIQRKAFCLLKKYYESHEDSLGLLDLIAKMKFQREDCR